MESDVNDKMLAMFNQFFETEHIRRLRSHFIVRDLDIPNPKYIRVGREHDGGYIMFDDFNGVKTAYSAGINDDVSWDMSMLNHLDGNIDVFMYDHTIEKLPVEHQKFHWSKTGLTGFLDPNQPELETLPRLIKMNGHADDYNMILKMDIEGAEYSVFQTIDEDTLEHFRQIVIEFHTLLDLKLENAIGFCVDKLNATHQLVHVHGNVYDGRVARGGLIMPNVIEGTYLRRKDYKFVKSKRFFPTALDQSNAVEAPDINLGYWG